MPADRRRPKGDLLAVYLGRLGQHGQNLGRYHGVGLLLGQFAPLGFGPVDGRLDLMRRHIGIAAIKPFP